MARSHQGATLHRGGVGKVATVWVPRVQGGIGGAVRVASVWWAGWQRTWWWGKVASVRGARVAVLVAVGRVAVLVVVGRVGLIRLIRLIRPIRLIRLIRLMVGTVGVPGGSVAPRRDPTLWMGRVAPRCSPLRWWVRHRGARRGREQIGV